MAAEGPTDQQLRARAAVAKLWEDTHGPLGGDVAAENRPRTSYSGGVVSYGFSGSHFSMAVPEGDAAADLSTAHHTVFSPVPAAAAAGGGGGGAAAQDLEFQSRRRSYNPATSSFGAFVDTETMTRPASASDRAALDAHAPAGGLDPPGANRAVVTTVPGDKKRAARALKHKGVGADPILGHARADLADMTDAQADSRMRSARRLSDASFHGGRPNQ